MLAMGSSAFVVISGPPGVGKTTYVKKLAAQLSSSRNVEGFYTEEVREQGARTGFDIVTLTGQRATLASVRNDGEAMPKVGKYSVDVSSFESVALPLLKQSTVTEGISKVLLIDEVGKMELFSRGFSSAVGQLLDRFPSSCPTLLLTIPSAGRGRPIPLVEKIRSHPAARIVNLSRSNRDDHNLQSDLLKHLARS